jgi:hypothetical protein
MLHMQPISHLAQVTSQMVLEQDQLKDLRIQLIADAGVAILVLLAITTVSVYKPWGRVQFGISLPGFKATTKRSMGFYLLIGFIVVVILFALLHFFNSGMRH